LEQENLRQPFADMHSVLSAEKLIDLAFSRASKKEMTFPKRVPTIVKVKRKEAARVTSVGQLLADRLMKTVKEAPKVDEIHPFYKELADVLVGVIKLKKSLGALNWAAKMVDDLAYRYTKRINGAKTVTDAGNLRKEAYGRIASIVKRISKDLDFLQEAQGKLLAIPSIDTEMITIVVAGYANTGKSTFVKQVSTAKPKIAAYPFTTKEISVGHRDTSHGRCQIIDTPGLLDRPLSERNKIELQAIIALKYLADVIIFIADPSETCGYPFNRQVNLYKEILNEFKDVPTIQVLNKADLTDKAKIEKAKQEIGRDSFEANSPQNIGVQEIFEEALKKATERKTTHQ
jgi:nucleolar GTP-binding protein